jgi:diaminohydroxyphosphoribosylaminopyrimidine deaminase/5-amino-6-(5-phosphoribosylamino)uracil reductase
MHNNKEIHEKYMQECIKLAKLAEGQVSPNPLVGSIVLDKNGNIAGKGYHQKYGENHAEVNALNEAGNKAEGGTIYVNLEPCSFYGKTPPCIDRIIKEKIKTLVIGMTDPNPKVSGAGIQKAKAAGIEVIENILNKESLKLNEIFIKHITEKKPFIAIKTASTIDGKNASCTGSSKWITSDAAREEVHRLRNKYDAILTGSGTLLADNPSLDCRLEGGRNPVRVVVDSQLRTSPDAKVYKDDGTKIIIATSEKVNTLFRKFPEHVKIITCPPNEDNKINLSFLTEELYKQGICSILTEAGGLLNGALLKYNLIDKAYFFIAPKVIADNTARSIFEGFNVKNINECTNFRFGEVKSFPPDIMIEGYLR